MIFLLDRDPVKAISRIHALRYVYRLPLIEEAHIHHVAELIRAARHHAFVLHQREDSSGHCRFSCNSTRTHRRQRHHAVADLCQDAEVATRAAEHGPEQVATP